MLGINKNFSNTAYSKQAETVHIVPDLLECSSQPISFAIRNTIAKTESDAVNYSKMLHLKELRG